MEKISVIVPVYNSVACLERCVSSICAQTYENLEIVLVDDGSTDGSGRLCEELSLKDARIRVYHKENGGASSARNLGISKAEGELIGFVDSDDYIEPYVYEKMREALAAEAGERLSIVQISRDEIAEDGSRLPDVCVPPQAPFFCRSEEFLRELLMHRGDCSFCTKLLRRELFAVHSFPEGELNEDFRLLTELLQEVKGVLILPQQGYHVVCREDSTTRRRTAESFSRVFLDIVENADRMQVLVDEKYPGLHLCAVRFGLYQRLDYLLHVPIAAMTQENDFYCEVKRYLRKHLGDTLRNPYLTAKNRLYLLLLTAAPKTVRKIHAKKMEMQS